MVIPKQVPKRVPKQVPELEKKPTVMDNWRSLCEEKQQNMTDEQKAIAVNERNYPLDRYGCPDVARYKAKLDKSDEKEEKKESIFHRFLQRIRADRKL